MPKNKERETKIDFAPMIRAVQYLDEALRRGVVVGVYEDSLHVDDLDIEKALNNVTARMAETRREIELTTRFIDRLGSKTIN